MDEKYKSLDEIMEELEDFESYRENYSENPEDDDYYAKIDNPPYRKSNIYTYIDNLKKNDFTSWMIFLMANRNEEVKEIIKKLEIIFNILLERKQKYQNLNSEFNVDKILDITDFSYVSSEIEYSQDLTTTQEEFRSQFISIGKLDFQNFEKSLKNLLNNNDIEEDLEFENMCLLFEELCKKLKKDFYIYPDGYITFVCIEEGVVSQEYMKFHCNLEYKTSEVDNVLEEFNKFKNTDMISIADLFFIYDYNSYMKKYGDKNEKIGITNSIKLALTKHHGLSIRKNSKKDFRRNYKKYKDYEIRYYITERSIRNKIKMMKSFIDKCNYKYLFLS